MRLYQVGNHETTNFLDPTGLTSALRQLQALLKKQHGNQFEAKLRGEDWRSARGLARTMAQVAWLVKNCKLGEAVWVRDTKDLDPVFVIRPVQVVASNIPSEVFTAPAKACWVDVSINFENIVSWGIFVCKRILGTSDWSQHSWGNAIDFHGSVEQMKALQNYLEKNAKRLNINYVIHNRQISQQGGPRRYYDGDNPHYDHVHVDFLPEKTGYPPHC